MLNQFDTLLKDSSSERVFLNSESKLDTSEELLLCVTAGEGSYTVNGKKTDVKSGMVIDVPQKADVSISGNFEVLIVKKARFKM